MTTRFWHWLQQIRGVCECIFTEDGVQLLVWEVQVRGANASGWAEGFVVRVDAMTGDGTIFGQG